MFVVKAFYWSNLSPFSVGFFSDQGSMLLATLFYLSFYRFLGILEQIQEDRNSVIGDTLELVEKVNRLWY